MASWRCIPNENLQATRVTGPPQIGIAQYITRHKHCEDKVFEVYV